MKKNQFLKLNEFQIEQIRKLARELRGKLGFADETPIANDIFSILDRLRIMLLTYPVKTNKEKPGFSAVMIYSHEGDEELAFIGINTSEYFDMQIFSIAHELYHYETKTGSHLTRLKEIENNIVEMQANRFAAELLLPENVIESMVIDEFRNSSLYEVSENTLLRFIARIQCTWWLPYRAIIKRLKEIEAISENQFIQLYKIDERDLFGKYGRIGLAINSEIFKKLNKVTNSIGTSPKEIEIIIRNFEDSLIDEDQFADTLSLFNQSTSDYGYEIKVSEEDKNELESFFNEENMDEG